MFQFSLLGFPVRVQPFFFLTVLLIGPHDLQGAAMWVPVAFIGVLAHELGHAAAIRQFGFLPNIQLHGFGGLTSWPAGPGLSAARRILISAAGPAVGISIGGLAFVAARVYVPETAILRQLVSYVVWVNLGWGVLNLLPVMPLDGGNIVTAVAEGLWGSVGRRIARIVSLVACVALGAWALMAGWLWSAILAGVLAFANFQALRAESR